MTIDEYLNQLKALERREERLYKKYCEIEEKATSPQTYNFGSGAPRGRNGNNTRENLLVELADASNEFNAAFEEYKNFRNRLQRNIYNLLYWQGLIIEQVYIYNRNRDNDLYGVNELLFTDDRREILAKLDEAKAALAEILRAQGVEIES